MGTRPCGRASSDLGREKTASASVELAHNLADNAANGEKTVHNGTMEQAVNPVKSANSCGLVREAGTRRNPAFGDRFRP